MKAEGKRFRGKALLNKHLNGERLTRNEAIIAKCYECECGYSEGIQKCTITKCPLNPFNPYSDSLNLSAQAD
jgi:hypothetical protein